MNEYIVITVMILLSGATGFLFGRAYQILSEIEKIGKKYEEMT